MRRGLRRNAHASAASRPPPPTRRTFASAPRVRTVVSGSRSRPSRSRPPRPSRLRASSRSPCRVSPAPTKAKPRTKAKRMTTTTATTICRGHRTPRCTSRPLELERRPGDQLFEGAGAFRALLQRLVVEFGSLPTCGRRMCNGIRRSACDRLRAQRRGGFWDREGSRQEKARASAAGPRVGGRSEVARQRGGRAPSRAAPGPRRGPEGRRRPDCSG